MIAFVKGSIDSITTSQVVVEAQGIGYLLKISNNTYQKIEFLKEVKLYTELIVREDSHTLYGFFDLEEKQIFNLLISVSGVGPNTGCVILSSMEASDVAQAILSDNVRLFQNVKGIGNKTAQRIILDLKDKVAKLNIAVSSSSGRVVVGHHKIDEASQALIALGFQRSKVSDIIKKIQKEDPSIEKVEDFVKAGIKYLAG